MLRRPEIPKEPGTFVLAHVQTKTAYVGYCRDLRHRAAIWDYNLRRAIYPVKGMPTYPSEEWQYWDYAGKPVDAVRRALEEHGYTLINERSRSREPITYQGKTQSLAEHARDAGISYALAYKRWRAGKPMDEVLDPGPSKPTRRPSKTNKSAA